MAGTARRTEKPQQARVPAAQNVATPVLAPSLAARFREIIKEFDDERKRASAASEKGKDQFERWKILSANNPAEAPYARRIVDLAATNPKDQASRDALIWVIDKPYRSDNGAYGDEVQRTVNLLVQHHANDPEVARLGLKLDNLISRRRDSLLEGIYANAEGREAKGLARFALANYLAKKAQEVAGANNFSGRPVVKYQTYDDQGKLVEKTQQLSTEEAGYRVHERHARRSEGPRRGRAAF